MNNPSPKTGKNVEHTRGSHADDFNDTEPCHCNEVPESKTSDEVKSLIEDFFEDCGSAIDTSSPQNFKGIKEWMREHLTALVARVRKEGNDKEGRGNLQGYDLGREVGKKEGALAVLADLEEKLSVDWKLERDAESDKKRDHMKFYTDGYNESVDDMISVIYTLRTILEEK